VTARAVAVVVAVAALAAGCKGGAKKPPAAEDAAPAVAAIDAVRPPAPREVVLVRRVSLDIVAPPDEHAPDEAALEARLARLGAGAIAKVEDKPPGWAAQPGTLRAVLTFDKGGTDRAPTILMTVEAELDLGEALGVAARAAGEQSIEKKLEPKAGTAAAIDELATTLVDQVATELTNKLTLRAGTPADLLAAVTDTDPELAAWALELGGERGDRALLPAATAALKSSARQRLAAIQYLVALGDPSAVPHLAASADFADRVQLAAIVEAVTALGGGEAREFLEMLAAGATDPDIADRAKQGLERIDRREGPTADAAP
jgi:hypothetical protein